MIKFSHVPDAKAEAADVVAEEVLLEMAREAEADALAEAPSEMVDGED